MDTNSDSEQCLSLLSFVLAGGSYRCGRVIAYTVSHSFNARCARPVEQQPAGIKVYVDACYRATTTTAAAATRCVNVVVILTGIS